MGGYILSIIVIVCAETQRTEAEHLLRQRKSYFLDYWNYHCFVVSERRNPCLHWSVLCDS